MYFLSMEMIQIRTEIRGMGFPEKPSLEKSMLGVEPRTSRSVDLFATDCAPRHIHVFNKEEYWKITQNNT